MKPRYTNLGAIKLCFLRYLMRGVSEDDALNALARVVGHTAVANAWFGLQGCSMKPRTFQEMGVDDAHTGDINAPAFDGISDREKELEATLRAIAPAVHDVVWCSALDILDKAKRAAESLGFQRGYESVGSNAIRAVIPDPKALI